MLVEIQQELSDLLSTGQWSRYASSALERFATTLEHDCGTARVMLVSSGTVAIELALRACHLKQGSEVILAAYDYPGNIRSIEAAGGKPVLVDVQPESWTVESESVREAITENTAAILVSHLYQNLAPVAKLRSIADEAGVILIEDACQAPLAMVDGRCAGTWGHLGTLSFGGSKVLTAGTGGAILANEARTAQRLKILLERPSPVYPLSGLQASTLLPQWAALEKWNSHRRASVFTLQDTIEKYPDNKTTPIHPSGNMPSLYKWAWLAPNSAHRDQQIARANGLGIPCGHGFPVFKARARKNTDNLARDRSRTFPNAEDVAKRTIVLDHRALAVPHEKLQDLVIRLETVWNNASCDKD